MTAEDRRTQPDVRSAYDRLAEDYDGIYRDPESRAEDIAVARMIARQLRRVRPPLGRLPRLLDLGCGTGWVLDAVPLAAASTEYDGIDLSPRMIAKAICKHAGTLRSFRVGDMNRDWRAFAPRSPYGTYDLVISTYCAASYMSAQHAAAESAACLRPGGRVFLMPHALGNARRLPHLPDEAYTPGEGQFYEPWRHNEALVAFHAAGFTDIAITGFRHPTAGPRPDARLAAHIAWLALERHDAWRHPDDYTFLIVTATYNP